MIPPVPGDTPPSTACFHRENVSSSTELRVAAPRTALENLFILRMLCTEPARLRRAKRVAKEGVFMTLETLMELAAATFTYGSVDVIRRYLVNIITITSQLVASLVARTHLLFLFSFAPVVVFLSSLTSPDSDELCSVVKLLEEQVPDCAK